MNQELAVKDNFTNNVKKWVLIDSQLKVIHEKVKILREEKNTLNTSICNQLKTSGNSHRKIMIHDGDLKFTEKKEYSPLTFGFLEEHLGKIMTDPKQVSFVIDHLKQQREIKIVEELKRTYKTNK